MSILASNMKTIRKELNCTQEAMADILNVGFRTYVRYEAGERDSPVPILTKVARLANISLEKLLTQEIVKRDVSPAPGKRLNSPPPEVKSCNFKAGTITFKKPAANSLISVDEGEKHLLGNFRKLSSAEQKDFLKSMGKTYKQSAAVKTGTPGLRRKTGLSRLEKEAGKVLAQAAAIKPLPGQNKGRPGRKKLDRKSLKEKVDKLKWVTRSVTKTTVR
ncbi:MAG: helix-turn-helix transcriptional regulator [Nitrospinaceae bacterium]